MVKQSNTIGYDEYSSVKYGDIVVLSGLFSSAIISFGISISRVNKNNNPLLHFLNIFIIFTVIIVTILVVKRKYQ